MRRSPAGHGRNEREDVARLERVAVRGEGLVACNAHVRAYAARELGTRALEPRAKRAHVAHAVGNVDLLFVDRHELANGCEVEHLQSHAFLCPVLPAARSIACFKIGTMSFSAPWRTALTLP